MKKAFYILIICAIIPQSILSQTTYRLKYNNIDISFDNQGAFGIKAGGYEGVYYDDEVFLFSSGFALCGYKDTFKFTNGAMHKGGIQDYNPGQVGSNSYDSRNIIYEVTMFPAFNPNWHYWKYAVELGAPFIDGDGDGIYNPIDKNNNRMADINEDSPLIEGDISLWTIFNDGVPQSLRAYNNIPPIGIEIQQTVFASNASSLANTIFVRYRITYKGLSDSDYPSLDSVLFSIWSDPDIGDAYNDFAGTDTLLNATYVYSDSNDYYYGDNPPALFNHLLQTPPVYIKDVTYKDNNLNNMFDINIDTPLDSSHNRRGQSGIVTYPGAADFGLRYGSFILKGDPAFDDPSYDGAHWNMMHGLSLQGKLLNPCDTLRGRVLDEDCREINPLFYFSGDPVNKTGWLSRRNETRSFTTTAAFQLKKNEPVDIIAAYTIGRGTDHLNSITIARELSRTARKFYESNFTQIPVGINHEPAHVVKEFQLLQNYPNPFNPGTIIKFAILDFGFTSLKVYDVLGNEVATLVNEERPAGEYEIQFDGSSLPSGIYFYSLNSGGFTRTNKMILLR